MNYAETIWKQLKEGMFPLVSGEEEKRLKLCFLQGMWSGRELVLQSTTLNNNELINFHNDLKAQIMGSLADLGCRPGDISVGKKPKSIVRAKINGEEV